MDSLQRFMTPFTAWLHGRCAHQFTDVGCAEVLLLHAAG
jgi:hypothetical protein